MPLVLVVRMMGGGKRKRRGGASSGQGNTSTAASEQDTDVHVADGPATAAAAAASSGPGVSRPRRDVRSTYARPSEDAAASAASAASPDRRKSTSSGSTADATASLSPSVSSTASSPPSSPDRESAEREAPLFVRFQIQNSKRARRNDFPFDAFSFSKTGIACGVSYDGTGKDMIDWVSDIIKEERRTSESIAGHWRG